VPLDFTPATQSLMLMLIQFDPVFFGQSVDDQKSHIMPRQLVTGTGVSQP
jgi:hypothetical protein